MNYYEELGLTPLASSHEIHQAHKHLARLLHPDRWPDADSRRLAECQMKRLNAVFEVLSDPDKRREYDLAMQPRPRLPMKARFAGTGPVRDWRQLLAALRSKHIVWRASVVLGGLILAWLAVRDKPPAASPPVTAVVEAAGQRPSPVPEFGGAPAPPAQPEVAPPPAPDTAQGRALIRENDRLREQLGRLREEIQRSAAESAQLQAQLAAALAPAADRMPPPLEPVHPWPRRENGPAEVAPPSAAPRLGPGGLSGTWVYVASPGSADPAVLYPPEYIEAVIQEQGDRITGRFRSRYLVKDQAISPDVHFSFQGSAADYSALDRSAQGGARGQLSLERVSDDSLRVTWFASRLGPRSGLVSGSATLVRLRDR